MVRGLLTLGFFFLMHQPLMAAEKPLTFRQWKQRQTQEAQNNLVRASNRLHLLKGGYYTLNDRRSSDGKEIAVPKVELDSARRRELKKAEGEIPALEEQVRSASENLKFSQELTLAEYVAVYLSQFRDQDDALKQAASGLNKEEVAELLRLSVRGGTDRNEDRSVAERQ